MLRIGVVDGSLCIAQFSLWRGAAPADMVLSCVGRLDQAGFDALDVMDGPLFQHCVKSGMDPWAWMRIAVSRAQRTPLNVWISSTTLFGTAPLSLDAITRGIACLAEAGIGRLTCYDVFNDPLSLARLAEVARQADIKCCAALIFTNSDASGRSQLPRLARQLAGSVDSICLWDPAGAMNPEVARELIPLMVEQCGDVALELRTHCHSGRAEITYLDAVAAGVRTLHTSVEALAGGISLPSLEYLVQTLRGGLTHVDGRMAEGSSEYISGFAERHGLAVGRHQLADFDAARFEVPPDLLQEFDDITEAGVDRQDLLEESRHLREQTGGISLVYPLGTLVLRHAAHSIRSRGKTDSSNPGTDAPGIANGREGLINGSAIERLRSGDTASTDLATLEQATGISGPDELLLIAAMFGPQVAEALRTSGSTTQMASTRADTPLDLLISELKRRPEVRSICVTKGDWRFELGT